MSWWLVLVLLFVIGGVSSPSAATTFVASPSGNDAVGTPCTDAQPCSVRRGIATMSCSNNDVLELLDGVYTGANYMLAIWPEFTGKSGTDNTHRCTIRARNDGQVFIDGEFARIPFVTDRNDWWTFQGFDMGNSSGTVAILFQSDHVVMQRLCASNAKQIATDTFKNDQVWQIWSSSNGLFEDICGFGTGRNTLQVYSDHTEEGAGHNISTSTNTFRRWWVRGEGSTAPTNSGNDLMPTQLSYFKAGAGGGGNIYENFITIWGPEQQPFSISGFRYGGMITRNGSVPGDTVSGWIAYGRDGFTGSNTNLSSGVGTFWDSDGTFEEGITNNRAYTDIFSDVRSQTTAVPAIFLRCLTSVSSCTGNSATRMTAIRNSSNSPASYTNFTTSNTNDCTSLSDCPNFYTGDSPGTGSRSCLEYSGGTLTGTKLWPWRMDDRIKAALQRANDAGTGGSALQGGAGAGYAAATVTSEIAARYGAIPSACNRSGTFTPSFPVATDFPSTPVLDDFNRANGALGANWINTFSPDTPFTIVSNQAAAAGGGTFSRMQWDAALFSGAHEVWALWPQPPACCTALSFAGLDGSEGSQWRLTLEVESGNTQARVIKVPAEGGATTILGPIDLGTNVSQTQNQGFGIRVSSIQTITIYWKWTDGNWYRVGSVIDTSLPMANTAIGFAGIGTSIRVDDFGGGTCCGGAISPSNVGRLGTQFPKPRRRRLATRPPLKRAA